MRRYRVGDGTVGLGTDQRNPKGKRRDEGVVPDSEVYLVLLGSVVYTEERWAYIKGRLGRLN